MEKFNEEVWMEGVRKTIRTVLTYGRSFITLNKNNEPVIYEALDAPNWKQGEYAVFIEMKEDAEQTSSSVDPTDRVRISYDSVNTIYERFDSSGILKEQKSTTKFKELPVICVGATDMDWDVDEPPLEGIGTCALHIYKKSADLSYSEFSSCVPTLVITGVDTNNESGSAANQMVGGGVALTISNEQAKVYYPQTDTNALQHVKIHIDGLFDEAKSYGASLLGGDKDEVESAEAIRLRQGASGASLSTMTRTIERGINKLLEIAQIDMKFKINFSLEENYLTPAEQSVLLDSWMNNSISYTTYFNNLQKAGIIEDERDMESEIKEIKFEKEQKQKDAMKTMEEQAKITSANSNNENQSTNTNKKNTGDESSAGRSKNLNRQGSDYEKEDS